MSAQPELMDREVPIADTSALLAINRAEIDGQIATARAFPRSVTAFKREAIELVTLDADMAEACIYALPRDGKTVAGPSARFAEVIQHAFGNNRGGGRVVAEDGGFIVAQGVYHDLEKNVQITMEVKRSITNKSGQRFKPDMIGVTGNAAASIAHRNAVLKGIPKALWLPIYEAARKVAVGDVKTLVERREHALGWFQNVNVTPDMVCAKLGIEGVDDIGLPELEILVGLRTAIREGTITPEDAFKPDVESTLRAATSAAGVADIAAKVAEKRDAKKPPAKTEAKALTPTELKAAIFQADTLETLEHLLDQVKAIADEAVQADVQDAYDAALERLA